jgi:hypothetical protein
MIKKKDIQKLAGRQLVRSSLCIEQKDLDEVRARGLCYSELMRGLLRGYLEKSRRQVRPQVPKDKNR